MITVGVTGGIGSGKSTVCGMLAAHGARVFDADSEARRLMTENGGVRSAVEKAFGPEAYREDGGLEKTYLARRIFSDEQDRLRMNAIVHPAVARAFDDFRREAEADGVDVLVREAALLPEKEHVDVVLAIQASLEGRVRRVLERDATTEEQVRARVRAQSDDETFLSRADAVITNDGTRADLKRQVDLFWKRLVRSSR